MMLDQTNMCGGGRYDYDPSHSRLLLRMPTEIHETVIEYVRDEIASKVKAIATGAGGLSADFARKVKTRGSSTVHLGNNGKRDPDGQFRHTEANYPGVILEVGYSQKLKDLPRLARQYIGGSKGQIRVVICIDLGYKDRKGTLSVWEGRIVFNKERKKVLAYVQTVKDEVRVLRSFRGQR